MTQAYCMKCRMKVEIKDPVVEEMKTSRGIKRMARGTCIECGTKVCAILKKE